MDSLIFRMGDAPFLSCSDAPLPFPPLTLPSRPSRNALDVILIFLLVVLEPEAEEELDGVEVAAAVDL